MDNRAKIEKALHDRLAVPLVTAGYAVGLGRRRTQRAAEKGLIPVNVVGTVPTDWVRRQLRLAEGREAVPGELSTES